MYVRQASRGRWLVIAGGALAAGALYVVSGAGSDGATPPVADRGEQRAPAPTPPTPTPARIAGAPLVEPPVTAPVLPAAIDLDAKQLGDDGVFTVALGDGRRAKLTLDPDLQSAAERLLNESRAPRGAIVAMATDGRVLALAGRRTEEPTGSPTGTFESQLATLPVAPSASVFKLVTASALLEAGVDPAAPVCFHGGLRSVSEHNLSDSSRDNRCESLSYGVAHSNNAILGKLAYQKLAPDQLTAAARTLGWTASLPATLTLAGRVGELTLPAARDLEYARAAAGFSSDSAGAKLSTMGGALVAATFANRGELPPAHVIQQIDDRPITLPSATRVVASETALSVARMMEETCASGSGARVFGKQAAVAGKTGTLIKTEPFFMEHSWFVGYAPAAKPEIVVSIWFGNPESWHLRANEAARRLIDRALGIAKAREKGRTKRRSRS